MMAAIAPPAARTVRALIQNRLIIARCASAAPSLMVSRVSIEEGARSKGWRVCISIVIFKILYSELMQGSSDAPVVAVRRALNSKHVKIFQSSFHRFCHIAAEGDHSLLTAHRKAL